MAGSSKRANMRGGADRISGLPDSVLHHILSFLTTKEAVRTWALSKRWDRVWSYVPSLIFNSDEFGDESKFVQFVDSVFESRQLLNLDTFKLRWDHDTSSFEAAERWLSHVVEAKPRVIVLETSGPNHYLEFGEYVFTCESLEELNVSTTIGFSEDPHALKPESINLQCLKKLELNGQIALDDDFMKKLMRGSPVLEELQLDCNLKGLSLISSQSLKRLEIYCIETDKFEISIPSLISLYMEGAVPGRILCNNLVSLVDAHVWVEYCEYDGDATFLSGFSNAEKLHFDKIESLDMFEKEVPNCPKFNNLKELNCQVTSFYPIAWFLKHAPRLEKLTLRYYFGCNSDLEKELYEGRDISFKCKELKKIKICYAGLEEARDAMELLSYNKKLPYNVELELSRC